MPVVPTFTNALQLMGFVAVLCYMAYGQYVNLQNARYTRVKVQEATDKTEHVRGMLNSHLEEYKRALNEQSIKDLDAHKQAFDMSLAKIRDENKETAVLLQNQIDKRIADLEATIASQKQTIQSGPSIAPITPEKRLNEIRGQE